LIRPSDGLRTSIPETNCQAAANERSARECETGRQPGCARGRLEHHEQGQHSHSVRNEIMSRVTDYRFWFKPGSFQVPSAGHPPIRARSASLLAWLRRPDGHPLSNPLGKSRTRALFKTVETFRFQDGWAFDFRGVTGRTTQGRQGTLADSNERAFKGFTPTYSFARDYGGLACGFKLDWTFVKPFVTKPHDRRQSYWFAPEFATTMRASSMAPCPIASQIIRRCPWT